MTPTIVGAALSGGQVKSLRELISIRFNKTELEMMTREEFDRKLADGVDLNQPFDAVVFDLIGWFERDGLLTKLVQVVAARKPFLKPALDAILGGVATPTDEADGTADLHQVGDKFRERRRWFAFLKVYKELHELLHNLDGILPQIEEEVDARVTAGTPIPDTTTADVRQYVADARQWAAQTEFPDAPPVCVWVPRFAAAADALLGPDPPRLRAAFESIARLPAQQLGHLNGELVACARRLEADLLVRLLDALPIPALGLVTAVARFRDPCDRLPPLIRDHNLCQQIDTELRPVGGLPTVSPAALPWAEVVGWLDGLAAIRPGDGRVVRTRKAADAFAAAPSADTFHDLIEKFDDLFKKADESLLRVTDQLVFAAGELTAALEAK